MMNSPKLLLSSFFLVLFLSCEMGQKAEARSQRYGQKKLFVFGDSYADTGNSKNYLQSAPWNDPSNYDLTFRGRLYGGKILTDFIAKYLELESPVLYTMRKNNNPRKLKYGMNFACGGTGVFDATLRPSLATQIGFFKKLIKNKVYTTSDLSNSVAYVSVAGNDYHYYLKVNGSSQGFQSYIASVVNQIAINLMRIHKLGVKKIMVGTLPPIECLPASTVQYSFQHCNNNLIPLVRHHNNLLKQAVAKLNRKTKKGNSTYLILDLYKSFKSVIDNPKPNKFETPLIPCCFGVSQQYVACGSVDENGEKKYMVCDNSESTFFWDLTHPTQAGWYVVFNKLKTMNAFRQI